MRAPREAAARAWTPSHPLAAVRGLLLLLALGLASWLFWAAFRHLGPDSSALPPFHSDAAIPVLMANESHWDLFHAFYFGQARFGAWPFFLAHWLFSLQPQGVTPQQLHAFSTAFLALGAPAAMLLCPAAPGLAALAYALSVLVPESRAPLFGGQPYAYQLPLLLWAWWVLRRLWSAEGPNTRAGWWALAAALCWLSTWLSPLSGPLLLALSLLEGFSAEARWGSRPTQRWLVHLLPAASAMAFEAALRWAYHLYVRAHYQRDFRMALRLDSDNLWANAMRVWTRLATPWGLVSAVVLSASVVLVVAGRLRAGGTVRRPSGLERTLLGTFLLAALSLAALVLVRHVRENGFSERYFVPARVFAAWGCLLALCVWVPSRLRGRAQLLAVLVATLALGGLSAWVVPRAGANPDYARLRATAQRLAALAPGELLLDGYWGTYVFAALAPPGQLLPLPRDGELNRIPALEARLPLADEVVVGHRDFLDAQAAEEPRWLFQYGVLLERTAPSFLSDGVDRFSRYRPTPVQPLAFRASPALQDRPLWDTAAETRLELEQPQPGTAAVAELYCLGLGQLPRASARGPDGGSLEVLVQPVPGAIFFLLPAAAPAQTLQLAFARQDCQLRKVRWFVPPPGWP